jgi:hypothetical protein
MYQIMQLKMHGFWTILYVCQEMVSSIVNSHLRVTVGHSFLAVGDWRRPHSPPSGSTSHPSTRSASFQWHVGGAPVPLRAPCGRTQAIDPT